VKVKLDENVPQRIVAVLEEWGHDVETCVSEGLGGQPDSVIADHVRAERRLLVTLDRGFSNIRQYPPGDLPGILVIRLPNQLPAMIEAALRGVLYRQPLDDLAGCTVIVQPGRIRVRRPEAET
jgi:predicted nuclease of predicted toxin-antitoxin system